MNSTTSGCITGVLLLILTHCAKFKIFPHQSKTMDPQRRILLIDISKRSWFIGNDFRWNGGDWCDQACFGLRPSKICRSSAFPWLAHERCRLRLEPPRGFNDAYICNQIGSVQTLSYFVQKGVLVYCQITSLPDRTGLVAEQLQSHPRFTSFKISLGYTFPAGSPVWPQSNACEYFRNIPSCSQGSDP